MVLFKIDGSVDMNAYKSLVAEVRFRRLLKYLILGPGFILLLPLLVILTMRWVNPSKSSYMLQQSAAGHQIQSKWTSLDEISPYAVLAVLAAEDIHFPQHQGFDFGQIKRAFRYNQIHKTSLGASTISQQVAKNLFLWHGKSYLRKGLEVYLTVLIELLWSKRRILEVYLNIAEMGPDLFGIGVASEHFFAKPPSALTPDDAASLAVVLPNPRLYAVSHPSAAVAERRDKVLQTVYYLESIKYLKNF